MEAREQAILADLVRGTLAVTREARAACIEVSHTGNREAANLDRLILLAEAFLRNESLDDADEPDYATLRSRYGEWDAIHDMLWSDADRNVSLPDKVKQLVERVEIAENKLARFKKILFLEST